MRLALEYLLRIPDEAPEIDRQLHPRLAALADLMPQDPQVLLQLQTHTRQLRSKRSACLSAHLEDSPLEESGSPAEAWLLPWHCPESLHWHHSLQTRCTPTARPSHEQLHNTAGMAASW